MWWVYQDQITVLARDKQKNLYSRTMNEAGWTPVTANTEGMDARTELDCAADAHGNLHVSIMRTTTDRESDLYSATGTPKALGAFSRIGNGHSQLSGSVAVPSAGGPYWIVAESGRTLLYSPMSDGSLRESEYAVKSVTRVDLWTPYAGQRNGFTSVNLFIAGVLGGGIVFSGFYGRALPSLPNGGATLGPAICMPSGGRAGGAVVIAVSGGFLYAIDQGEADGGWTRISDTRVISSPDATCRDDNYAIDVVALTEAGSVLHVSTQDIAQKLEWTSEDLGVY